MTPEMKLMSFAGEKIMSAVLALLAQLTVDHRADGEGALVGHLGFDPRPHGAEGGRKLLRASIARLCCRSRAVTAVILI